MLTEEQNELLCRVGPGTAMGRVLEHYWLPVLLSDELRAEEQTPKRVKLLGRTYVAFREHSRQSDDPRRALPASWGVAGARSRRGLRCALPVPRLGDRQLWSCHRDSD